MRKGSKLKPDAPEFVPSRSTIPSTSNLAKGLSKEAAKAQKEPEKGECRTLPSLGKKADKKPSKRIGGMTSGADHGKYTNTATDTRDSTADNFQSAGSSNEPMTEGDVSGADRPKPKRGRVSRRNMAKTEPASRVQELHDGAQDSDVTAVSSGEGQPMQQGPAMV
jgi:hypothetical protein